MLSSVPNEQTGDAPSSKVVPRAYVDMGETYPATGVGGAVVGMGTGVPVVAAVGAGFLEFVKSRVRSAARR